MSVGIVVRCVICGVWFVCCLLVTYRSSEYLAERGMGMVSNAQKGAHPIMACCFLSETRNVVWTLFACSVVCDGVGVW